MNDNGTTTCTCTCTRGALTDDARSSRISISRPSIMFHFRIISSPSCSSPYKDSLGKHPTSMRLHLECLASLCVPLARLAPQIVSNNDLPVLARPSRKTISSSTHNHFQTIKDFGFKENTLNCFQELCQFHESMLPATNARCLVSGNMLNQC
jgi:hypothetical protein